MKPLKIIIFFSLVVAMTACEKDFLERRPETAITANRFFNTTEDLKTYSNKFYDYLGASLSDYGTDNMALHGQGNGLDNKLRGQYLKQTDNTGGWSWSILRNINYMLINSQKTQGDEAEKNHYIGLARFFRARFYISKIQRFGKAPWYSGTLETNSEGLYKPSDPRELVVDSIMSDLEFAATHMKTQGDKAKVSKWAAYAQLSRFALYEGTFRKYHTELNLSDADQFLQKSVAASEELMNNGGFSLYTTGNPDSDYRNLFALEDQSSVSEAILILDYDSSNRTNQKGVVFDYYWGLSKSLVDSYLTTDGNPIDIAAGEDEKVFADIFKDRDPRLSQTIMAPGYIRPGSADPFLIKLRYGGYNQVKFWPQESNKLGWRRSYDDQMVYRYGEVLLNYAEAKAELNTLQQSDIEQSIGLLRARVGMPTLDIATANATIDPILKKRFPNVTGANAGAILEIRRERRVELAAEGFREQDIYRWKVGAVMAETQFGIYVPQLGALDVTGDGTPDIAVLKDSKSLTPIASLSEEEQKSLVKYYLYDDKGKANGITLSEGDDSGFIGFVGDKTSPKSFLDPAYYYYPIPLEETVLNPKLFQPPGWDEARANASE